jgi:ABC-type multidrug transport system ATPase subunit
MIRIDTVTKVYGRRGRAAVTALDAVSLSVEPGVWGIVGPNGAGKSTLLGVVLGFLRPTSGTVELDGRRPGDYLRRHGAAYLPERFGLPASWPVRSALMALARTGGLEPARSVERVDDVLSRTGLEDHAHRAMGTLSRGLNQRVGLAQALLGEHPLVVLDEPTEGLDPLWRVRFRDLVADLRGEGRTLLLASHDLGEVERVADRVVVLDQGRVADVLDARPTGGPRRYRIRADARLDAVRATFPDCEAAGDGADGEARVFTVTVSDASELSHRLAALLDAGATVHEVAPVDGDLEARVRDRLEDGP